MYRLQINSPHLLHGRRGTIHPYFLLYYPESYQYRVTKSPNYQCHCLGVVPWKAEWVKATVCLVTGVMEINHKGQNCILISLTASIDTLVSPVSCPVFAFLLSEVRRKQQRLRWKSGRMRTIGYRFEYLVGCRKPLTLLGEERHES